MDSKFLTPEELNRLMELTASNEKRKQLDEQLAQAQALRDSKGHVNYMSPGAAALGGLGDVINAYRGSSQAKALQDKQAALTEHDLKLRQEYGGKWYQSQHPEQAQAAQVAATVAPGGQAAPQDGVPDLLRATPGQSAGQSQGVPMDQGQSQGVPMGQAPDSLSQAGGVDVGDPGVIPGTKPKLSRKDAIVAAWAAQQQKQNPEDEEDATAGLVPYGE